MDSSVAVVFVELHEEKDMTENKYDVFICFKHSTEDGQITEDSLLAEQLYDYLKGRGFSVFFSNRELEFLGVSQYNDIINKALEASRFLIAVGCSRRHLESKWVQYEWSSFQNEIRSDTKQNGELYVLYKGMNPKDLPYALRQHQAFNAAEDGAFLKIGNYIENALKRRRASVEANIAAPESAPIIATLPQIQLPTVKVPPPDYVSQQDIAPKPANVLPPPDYPSPTSSDVPIAQMLAKGNFLMPAVAVALAACIVIAITLALILRTGSEQDGSNVSMQPDATAPTSALSPSLSPTPPHSTVPSPSLTPSSSLPPSPSQTSSARTVGVGETMPFAGYNWIVLEVIDGMALLLSEIIIDEMAYHDNWEEITWEHSSLRQWLNGDYYNSFAAEDRDRIAETGITNADNPWFGTPGGNLTTDRIFLLSLEEVVRYLGDSGQLGNQDHPDNEQWGFQDSFSSARVARDAAGADSWWWLRSPGYYSVGAAYVGHDGYLHINGYSAINDSGGVRPALWLNL